MPKKNSPMFSVLDGEVLVNTKYFPRRIRGMRHAIKLSIAKWEFIAAELSSGVRILDDGQNLTCGLCKLYNTDEMSLDECCKRCPVMKATGKIGCRGTPYEKMSLGISLELTQEEVSFLKSLKP